VVILTVNPQVPGSSPGRGAKEFKALQKCEAFCFQLGLRGGYVLGKSTSNLIKVD